MRIEDVTVAIHPRNAWEAIDLGLLLVRHWWRSLLPPWLIAITTLFLVLSVLLSNHFWLVPLIFWWLKPALDRILLYHFSEQLFGHTPTTAETLSAIPNLMKTGLITNLTLLRFNLSRSFHLPIWQLEGLRGSARRQRIQVLNDHIRSYPSLLTIACMHLEAGLYIGPLLLMYLLVPSSIDLDLLDMINYESSHQWLEIFTNLLYVLAVAVIEPIYVAAGFLLYINRRTELEAWDIELSFRQLAQRLKNLNHTTVTGILATLLLASTLFSPAPGYADAQPDTYPQARPAEASAEVIADILQRHELNSYHIETLWKPIQDQETEAIPDPDISPVIQFIARSFRLTLWIIAAAAILWLLINHKKWQHLLRYHRTGEAHTRPPATLFGLDITPETLPSDIPKAAQRLLQQDNPRAALSLLYRGALMVLLHRDHLRLSDSHTEGDILKQASQVLVPTHVSYLRGLTRTWERVAYGHQPASPGDILDLCEQWSRHFGQPG